MLTRLFKCTFIWSIKVLRVDIIFTAHQENYIFYRNKIKNIATSRPDDAAVAVSVKIILQFHEYSAKKSAQNYSLM